MTDITPIFEALIALATAIITTFLVPYIKEKLDDARFEKLLKWTRIAVEAAEKLFNETGLGENKKAYVLAFLQKHGYSVDIDEIDVLIESAVYEITIGA